MWPGGNVIRKSPIPRFMGNSCRAHCRRTLRRADRGKAHLRVASESVGDICWRADCLLECIQYL